MKKLMFGLAIAAVGSAFAVESSNIVGYYTVNATAGKYNLVAINIEPTSTATFTLDELFPTNALTTSYGTAGGADQLRTWDWENQCYKYFYRFYKKMGGGAKNYHWVENTAEAPLATVTLKAGDSVFYYPQSNNQTLTIPGSVPNSASGILKQGYNMISVGFPASWNPNDEGTEFWSDSAKFTAYGTAGGADQIRYWDAANQCFKYYYLFYKKMGGGAKNYKWVENTAAADVLDESLDIGAGFFYYKQAAGTTEFTPNLKVN